MKLDMCLIHKYLAVVDKMAALTRLEYRQSSMVSDKYLPDLVQFIQKHRSAFPQNRSWKSRILKTPSGSMSMETSNTKPSCACTMTTRSRFMKLWAGHGP